MVRIHGFTRHIEITKSTVDEQVETKLSIFTFGLDITKSEIREYLTKTVNMLIGVVIPPGSVQECTHNHPLPWVLCMCLHTNIVFS